MNDDSFMMYLIWWVNTPNSIAYGLELSVQTIEWTANLLGHTNSKNFIFIIPFYNVVFLYHSEFKNLFVNQISNNIFLPSPPPPT